MLSENSTSTPAIVATRENPLPRRVAASWLTGEAILIIVLGAVAFALRLMALGQRPMDTQEAQQALVAWRILHGQGAEAVGYSPLLALGNLLTFFLVTASDFSARLVPALAGTLLALTPLLFRRWLGRVGALAGVALLSFSPTAVFFSRYAGGEIAVVACALPALAGLMHFLDSRDPRRLWWTVIGGTLMLTAGPAAYSILLITFSFGAVLALGNLLGHPTGEWRALTDGWQAFRGDEVPRGRFLLAFILLPFLVGTALLLYIPGFQSVIDLFPAWLSQIGAVSGDLPWYQSFLVMGFYEPLLALFGFVGILSALSRRNLLTSFLVYWAAAAFYVYTLFGGRTAGDVLVGLVPLALLAGRAVGDLVEEVARAGSWEVEGLFLALAGPIAVYTLLQLSGYARTGQSPYVLLAGVGVILTVTLAAGYTVWVGPRASLRSLGLASLLFLALTAWGTNWRLNYNPATSAQDVLSGETTSIQVNDLLSTLRSLSAWRAGDVHELPLTVVALRSPVLDWYLREFRDVNYTGAVGESPQTQIYIAPDVSESYSPGESYRGQTFELTRQARRGGFDLRGWVNWLLYRQADTPGVSERIVLWSLGGGGRGVAAAR